MLLLLWLLFCVAHLAVELPPKPLSVNPEPTRGTLAGRLRAKTRWLPSVCTNGLGLSQGGTTTEHSINYIGI